VSGLETCTVLIVEDQMEIRTLLASILRTLGVGNVLRANNGAHAIEMLKDLKLHPDRVGATEVDAIISDWIMPEMDGATLLRWIRRHTDSPNRYMPFLMISAVSDGGRVELARDLGVNGFMAKPFTGATVATHLLEAMLDERHYVWIGQYFGPDRRRRLEDVPLDQRDSETPYEDKGVKYFPPPKTLRRKIGKGFEFDLNQMAQVQKEVNAWSENFQDWTKEYIERLQSARAACGPADQKRRRALFGEMNIMAHELRGLGGTFGFPLVTSVARSLFDLTQFSLDQSDDCVSLVGTHIDTLKAILREDVRDEGDAVSQALVEELEKKNAEFMAAQEA